MNYSVKRILCILLCLVIVFQLAEPVFAVRQENAPTSAQAETPVMLEDAEGNAIVPDESWEETYPYGAFGFDTAAADVKEGEDTVITVYRLGGTKGKATAYINYSPLLVPNEDGTIYYGYALSGKDLTLEVEDPLPVTAYQPVGKPADPEPCGEAIEQTTDGQGYVLTLGREAEHYQWEILYDGRWCSVGDSDRQTLAMDAEYMDGDYDYRCVYTLDGVRYCTDSLKGIPYEKPEPEPLEEAPADIELNPEQTFTAVDLDDEEDPYSGWVFGLTFAEGEWQKQIRLHAGTDDVSEAMEGATMRIAYTDGGEICAGAETLLYHVEDLNESTPSTVGFAETAVAADKSEGTVEIPVRREGGSERPVSVEYRTVDGTAKAGTDYVAASGTLLLYGNVTELSVKVELIDTEGVSRDALDFAVELSELKGDDNCTLTASSATVSLTDDREGQTADNLATALHDGEAVDLTGAVTDAPTAANSGSQTVLGEQETLEDPVWEPVDLIPVKEDEMSTQVYEFPTVEDPDNPGHYTDLALLDFGTKGDWKDTADLAKVDNFDTSKNISKVPGGTVIKDVGNKAVSGGYKFHTRFGTWDSYNGGVVAYGKKEGWIGFTSGVANPIGQMYSHYSTEVKVIYGHDETYDAGGKWYGSWLVPQLVIGTGKWDKKDILQEPRDTRIEVDSDGDYVGNFRAADSGNWNVQGKSSGEGKSSYGNPYTGNYSGDIKTTGPVGVTIDFPYHSHEFKQTDPLENCALLELHYLNMTRRMFKKDAFTVDIATPNDESSRPYRCSVISDYSNYLPSVNFLSKEGGSKDNRVYVGSTISFKSNENIPEGLVIDRVDALCSRDNGSTWEPFHKFQTEVSIEKGICNVKLLGKKGSELTMDEIEQCDFRFRLVYKREQRVKVDLTPSLPRDENGNVLTDEIEQLFNNYAPLVEHIVDSGGGAQYIDLVRGEPTQDHCFGDAHITYGYSTYDTDLLDFSSEYHAEVGPDIAHDPTPGYVPRVGQIQRDPNSNAVYWYLPQGDDSHGDYMVSNIQWINFRLPEEDELVINGRSYKGNETIYFTEGDLAGDIIIKYYHSACKSFINPMTTELSWMRLYLDADGNERIDGAYNEQTGAFVLDSEHGDKFVRSLRQGESFNELEVEPVALEGGGTGQYFILACYSMTPRCLTKPEGPEKDNRAQVLGAITSAIDPGTPAYSEQTPEQRKYNYVISGKDPDEKYTSDDHPMYEAAASAKTVLSIPLGGDKKPAYITKVNDTEKYVWEPEWYENNLYSYEQPDLITIKNTPAGPTEVARGAELKEDGKYEYSDPAGLRQMNGYLASLRGTSTFVLVSQIQAAGTGAILKDPKKYPVTPDSVTMSRVSTSPDGTYLQENKDSSQSEMGMPTGGEDSEMPEFNMPFDINLGDNEVGITDYVSIIMGENKIGFAVSVPLIGFEKEGNTKDKWSAGEKKTNPKLANEDFFKTLGNFGDDAKAKNKKLGDKSYGKSIDEHNSNASDKAKAIGCGKVSASLSFAFAFVWQYNPLDNGYYFSAWEIGVEGELGFRGQVRLTVCPAFYGFLDVKFSLEIKTGLGVIRDTKHGLAVIDAKTPSTEKNAVTKRYYASGVGITESEYNGLSKKEQEKYVKLSSGKYAIPEEALSRKSFVLTEDQYELLEAGEKANYHLPVNGYYVNKKYDSLDEAKAAMTEEQTYTFSLETKAFEVRFDGKLYMEVQEKDGGGSWVKAAKESGFISGVISSDGTRDTLVVIRQQDEMKLDKPVRIVLRALEYNEKTNVDQTKITYIAPVDDIYDQVHWNGIKIAPELSVEIGIGAGVEVLKAEVFLHISLGAEFLLWGFNPKYDPAIPEYLDKEETQPNPTYQDKYYCRVDSFDFTIGLALRLVLVVLSYELDMVSYQVHFEADGKSVNDEGKLFKDGKWSYEWHFLNDMAEQDADDPDAGVTIRLPKNTADTQKIFSPEENEAGGEEGLSTQAFDPRDPTVPFQTSGYGSTMDSANLTSGIPEGGDYKVVRAGEKNYIVYTLSRPGSGFEPEDSTMLVMSELGYSGSEYGLVNPNGSGAEPYIVLDREAQATGDLDFDAWADGDTVRAAWVSYGSPSQAGDPVPTKPTGPPAANEAGTTINADNYQEFAGIPAAKAWYDYYLLLDSHNAYLQQRAQTASRNTVVKTAGWSPAGTSFTNPEEIMKNDDYGFVFQPSSAGSGDAVFFASTAMQDTDGAALGRYREYLETKKLDQKVKNYLAALKKANLDLLGTQSALNFAVKNGSRWTVSQTTLLENQTLANVDFAPARDGAFYVAYTTEQTEYPADTGDMVTVYRLYLRRVKEKDGEIIWGRPFLIRELRDFDQDKGGTDGVYSGGALMEGKEYDSPYLSNLKFLTGNLDTDILTGSGTGEPLSTQAVAEQTLLSFEMNGSSYLIPESTLESITGGSGGMIYPFFTPPIHENADGTTVPESASGKLGVDINTDDNHNLYAVYMGAVEGTTSNALYLSVYDASVGRWGDGTMLAMHDMNTWEAAVRMDLDRNERELAYLYRNDEIRAREDALTAMYGEDALNTVKEIKAKEDADRKRTSSDLGDGHTFTFSSVQTVKGAKDNELLAVTQGSLKPLTVSGYTDGRGNEQYVLTPKYDEDGLVSTRGTYAVSFGQGEAKLGKGRIEFAMKEFGEGTRLNVTVQAENVGTSAFRGSENQPITAQLKAGGQLLAEWKIRESVFSGQAIELSGDCSPLSRSLADGDEFILVLSEYRDDNDVSPYNGITETLSLFTIEQKPDLSVEDLKILPAAVNNNGADTTLDVSFVAANKGSADAENVYAQFSYISGYDAEGEPVYSALPLTDSKLEIGMQESLSGLLSTQDTEDDPENGIVYLNSNDGAGRWNSNLRTGFGKRVKGTIRVPASAFCVGESKYAQIRVELFSAASGMTVQAVGVNSAVHDEYCADNNAAERQVEAFTSFTAAHAIVIPLGTTTRIPVSAVSSRNTRPVITLEEISDEDGRNIGIFNFRQSRAERGMVSGTVSITPVSTGSGMLHVTDTDTNTTFSVAFEVTEAGTGIDIYRDNEAFSFYNRDHSRYDQKSVNQASQNWGFSDVASWGTGETLETPMRGNLATGEHGTFFAFDTVAESIDLYFKGTVSVTSTNPDFARINNGRNAVEITNNTGGNAPVRIELGRNDLNDTFRVTVTVVGKSAVFDRMTERYAGNVAPVPVYDGASPMLIWSRSFPATGSVSQGTIPLKLYILDNNGIAGLTIDGRQITNPEDEADVTSLDPDQLLWCYDFGELSANKTYNISAVDISNNVTAVTLPVDWFLPDGSDPNGTATVPPYSAQFRQNGRPLSGAIQSTDGLDLHFAPDTSDPDAPKRNGNTFEAYYFDGTDFNKMSSSDTDTFAVSQNGIYWARVLNPGTDSGTADDTWSAQVLNLTQIDKGVLQASLAFNGSTKAPALSWSAVKNSSVASVSSVTINGWPVTSETGTYLSGQWPIRFNGIYSLRAEDSVTPPNDVEQKTDVTDMKVRDHDGLVTVTGPKDKQSSDGAILLDATHLNGGSYDSKCSEPEKNIYYGRYRALLLTPQEAGRVGEIIAAPEEAEGWISLEKGAYTHAWTGLPRGDYRLVIMDDGDGGRTDSGAVPGNCLVKTVRLREPLDKTVFIDVRNEKAFYYDPVYWAYYAEPQITNGIDRNHFGPDRPCTRAQVVTFLWRAAGCPPPAAPAGGRFTDIVPGSYYERAVFWAVGEGITLGMSLLDFAPDTVCTRGQIVTFLWRFKGMPEPERTETPFTDLKKGAFYEKAVAWAVENEITNGMDATHFGPDATCTRGQIVTFLSRATED